MRKLVLLALAAVLPSASAQGTLLYFNDAHELAPLGGGQRGGMARLATQIERIRSEQPETLVLFGGDLAGGTLFGEFRGQPIVEAFNQIGVDLANFGQHEFDFGAAQAQRLVQQSKFPWISSNLTQHGQPFAGAATRKILSVGKVKVGFIGLTTAMETTNAGDTVQQGEVVEAAKREVAALQAEGAELIVAITQQPLEADLKLAKEVPELDLILSEEESETRTTITAEGGTVIAKPAGNIGSVIRVDIHAPQQPLKLSVLPIGPELVEQPQIAELATRYMTQLERRLDRVITQSSVDLDAGAKVSRVQETALGSLIADAFREATGADIALMQGGGIRGDKVFPAGPVTLKTLTEILPFGNQVMMVEVDGRTLQAALENGVSKVDEYSGRFPQASGLTYRFDPAKPVGQRVSEIRVADKPLDPQQLYKVALGSYLAAGGDGYTMFKGARVLISPADGVRDVTALSEYLQGQPTIAPQVDGRIQQP